MTKFKMLHGTPNFDKPALCKTCRNSHIMHGRGLNEELTLCHANSQEPFEVRRPVVECSEYEDKTTPPLWQLEKIAWKFSVDNANKPVGFLSPKKWKAAHGDDDD